MILLDPAGTQAVDRHALGFGDFEGIYATTNPLPPQPMDVAALGEAMSYGLQALTVPPETRPEPPALVIEFLNKQIRLTSPTERTVTIEGDGDLQLEAGKPVRRKLRGDRNTVTIDGTTYHR